MILRQKFAIGGAVAGLARTGYGMYTAYLSGPISATPGEIALQFLVFSIFTIPFAGGIGLGLGLLVEGLLRRLKSS